MLVSLPYLMQSQERRISIVKDTPGVTRDRIYADVSLAEHEFYPDRYRRY